MYRYCESWKKMWMVAVRVGSR